VAYLDCETAPDEEEEELALDSELPDDELVDEERMPPLDELLLDDELLPDDELLGLALLEIDAIVCDPESPPQPDASNMTLESAIAAHRAAVMLNGVTVLASGWRARV
jgi:hypothetical protein